MTKIAGMVSLLIGVSGLAVAGTPVPEIDPGSAGTALAFLSAALLIFRERRKK